MVESNSPMKLFVKDQYPTFHSIPFHSILYTFGSYSSSNCALISSSKNFTTLTSSESPLRLLVLTKNSLARCCSGLGSNGCKIMPRSKGSPGTMDQ
mmetsp:Transcript_11697/g.16617  ORF Transcript_11697/g.16617 Transcript_11697/m.16617 type:complete len:96 (-) Transcript_11697:2596-2883(-)